MEFDRNDEDCLAQAVPDMFVPWTAVSTNKETVGGCLKYFADIKGVSMCCAPSDGLESGEDFSLSWRIQEDNTVFEKALHPSS